MKFLTAQIFFLIITVSISLLFGQQVVYANHYVDYGLDDVFYWREHDNNAVADVESNCWFEGQNELPDDQTGISWWCESNTSSSPVQSQMYIMKTFPFSLLHNGTTSTITWDLLHTADEAGPIYMVGIAVMDGAYVHSATTNKLGFPDDVNWGADGACNGGYANPAWANSTGWILCMDNDNTSNQDDYITGTGSIDSVNTGAFTTVHSTSKGEIQVTTTITNTEWLTATQDYITIFLVFVDQYTSGAYKTDHYIQPNYLKITNTDYGTLQWDFPQSAAEVTTWETYGGAGAYQLNGTSNDYGYVYTFNESVPDPPTNLYATIDTADIDLTWTAPIFNGFSPIIGYKIERESPIGGGFSTLVANTGSTATTYEDSTIVVGTEYNYRVRALNVHGESLPSNESKDGSPSGSAGSDPTPNVNCTGESNDFTLYIAEVGTTTVTLCWNGEIITPVANILGYQINYTKPWGDPLTVLTGLNNTGDNATTRLLENLTPSTQYSFRVQSWMNGSANNVTNIANTTTLPIGFDAVGDFNFTGETNYNIIDWIFTRQDLSATDVALLVNYPDTFNATCNFQFKFSRANQTFSNISTIPVGVERQRANFTFTNFENDLVTAKCIDENTGSIGRYILYHTDFPLKDQIADFRNGTYGTMGEFGIFDFMTLAVLIFSMIGFNRVNPAVGAIFNFIIIGVASYFGFIENVLVTALTGAVITIVMLAVFVHNRNDVDN